MVPAHSAPSGATAASLPRRPGTGSWASQREAVPSAPVQAYAVPQVDHQSAARARLGGADVLLGRQDRAPAVGRVVGVDAGARGCRSRSAAPPPRPRSGPHRARPAPVPRPRGRGRHASATLRCPSRAGQFAPRPWRPAAPAPPARSSLQRIIGTEMDSAATTWPVRSRTGAATQLTSGLDSRCSTAMPRLRISARASRSARGVGDAVRRHRGAAARRRGCRAAELRSGQGGEQHLADGGAVGGQAAAGGRHHPDRVRGVHLGDVDDVRALEDRDVDGLAAGLGDARGPPAGPRRPGPAARRTGCRAGTAARPSR